VKRQLHGTYVSVELFHLFRYLEEQMFRFNNRGNRESKISDADRFQLALSQIAGKRLTFAEVTAKWEKRPSKPSYRKRGRKPVSRAVSALASRGRVRP